MRGKSAAACLLGLWVRNYLWHRCLYTPGTEFLYNRYLFALLEYATLRCVRILPHYVEFAGWRNHHEVGDVTGVFQIPLDHGLVMLR